MTSLFRSRRDARAQAFDALVRPHVRALVQSARRLTGSKDDGEDLVQDVLVKLYRRQSNLADVLELRPWLLRVLYREFIDFRRRASRNVTRSAQSLADEETDPGYTAPAESEPTSEAERLQLAVGLGAALAKLTPDQRALVTLHFLDGYTLEHLTVVFDVPLGTLKSRVHRTRATLRSLLGMEPFGDNERDNKV